MNPLEQEARKQELISLIAEAFDGVERGNGVTLHEALVIDNYGSRKERVKARKRDTEARWQDVPSEHISYGAFAFAFFDPQAFHYYLPAYLVWYLQYMGKEDSNTFHFLDCKMGGYCSEDDKYYDEGFELLNLEQSKAVAQCLVFLAARQKALVKQEEGYWRAWLEGQIAGREVTQEKAQALKKTFQQHQEDSVPAARALHCYWGQFL